MSTQNHLLSEIKRELDWSAEEVSRTETEVMRLEDEFSKSLKGADEEDRVRLIEEKKHLQDRVGLHDAYSLQRRAAQRFYILSQIFEIGSSKLSSDELREELGKFLYRATQGVPETADHKDKLLEIAEALATYFGEGYSDEADEAIREAWQNIEETLRTLGRK